MNLLEPSLPNLEILQIGFNLFTELGKADESTSVEDQKIKGFAKLEDLHLEGNKLVDWNQILRLSRLPKYVYMLSCLPWSTIFISDRQTYLSMHILSC